MQLTVTTWNVLADTYMRRDWFPDTPDSFFKPGARTNHILDILEELPGDVIALQEVEPYLVGQIRRHLGTGAIWTPRNANRVDGCLTLVREPWKIQTWNVLAYSNSPGGQVAQLVELSGPDNSRCLVANTHLQGDALPSHDPDRAGIAQIVELAEATSEVSHAIIAGDLNDLPDGPVREVLKQYGFEEGQGDGPTSKFNAGELRALDVVAGRDHSTSETGGQPPVDLGDVTAPGVEWPSDHVPATATFSF